MDDYLEFFFFFSLYFNILRVWKFWNGGEKKGFGKERLVTSKVTTFLVREELKKGKRGT